MTVTYTEKLVDLKCDCGSNYIERRRQPSYPPQPRHRKRRIQKKMHKAWLQQNFAAILTQPLLATPKFFCSTCNKSSGYYEVMGKLLQASLANSLARIK